MTNRKTLIVAFAKYHALGNDFLIVDAKSLPATKAAIAKTVRAICDRHTGVGADGVVCYECKRRACSMRIFNADGSEAELSGNGLRLLAHHLHLNRFVKSEAFTVKSPTALNHLRVLPQTPFHYTVQAQMSVPVFETRKIPMKSRLRYFISQEFRVKGGALLGTAVSVGNPHIVFFVDHFDFDWQSFGREVEGDKRFPQRVNVEFARIVNRKRVEVRIWERGVGATSSSGTGASATVAAGIANGWLDHRVVVRAPAGKLEVALPSLDQPIQLTGPSTLICAGDCALDL